MMRYLLLLLTFFFLTGCLATTSGLSTEGEIAYFQAQAQAANKPMFELECPESGCVISSLRVNNPNQQEVRALETSNPLVDSMRVVGGIVERGLPWWVVGNVAKAGIKNAGDTINSTTTTTDNSTTVDYNRSDSTSSVSTIQDSNNETSTSTSSTTSTTTTSSISDSNNEIFPPMIP